MRRINKRAQFSIGKFLIGLAMISAVFGLYFLYVTELATDYGATDIINPEMNETYNKFNEDYADVGEMFEELQNPGGLGFVGAAGTLFKSAWNIVLIVFKAPIRLHTMLVATVTLFGIPSAVANLGLILLYFVILVLIIFSVVNYLSRGGRPL